MKALISSTLTDLLVIFARSMAAEGKPNKPAMEEKLKCLCDEAVSQRDREIITQIKGQK